MKRQLQPRAGSGAREGRELVARLVEPAEIGERGGGWLGDTGASGERRQEGGEQLGDLGMPALLQPRGLGLDTETSEEDKSLLHSS